MNKLESTGEAWGQLEEKVDSLVEAFIEEKSLPGMTVAVTKQGRLLPIEGLRLRSRGRNEEVADEAVLAQ